MNASIGALLVLIAACCVALGTFRVHPAALGRTFSAFRSSPAPRIRARQRSEPTRQRKRTRYCDILAFFRTAGSSAAVLLASACLAVLINAFLHVPIEIHSQLRFTWAELSLVGIPSCSFFRRVFGWCDESLREPESSTE